MEHETEAKPTNAETFKALAEMLAEIESTLYAAKGLAAATYYLGDTVREDFDRELGDAISQTGRDVVTYLARVGEISARAWLMANRA